MRSDRLLALCLLASAGAPAGAFAQEQVEFKVLGRVYDKGAGDVRVDDAFEDESENHLEAYVQAKLAPTDAFQLVVAAEVDQYTYGRSSATRGTLTLQDAYAFYQSDRFSMKLGNQVLRWGKTDEISPLDIVNPEDLRDGFVRSRVERKLAVPMANAQLFYKSFGLQGIVIPWFEPTRIDLFGTDWALLRRSDEIIGARPLVRDEVYARSLSSRELGVRQFGTIGRLDYGLVFFDTRSDLPSLGSFVLPPGVTLPEDPDAEDLVAFAVATGQPLKLRYDRTQVFGLELEALVGPVVLRSDVAYTSDRLFLDRNLRRASRPVAQWVAGFDYSGEGIYMNFQVSQDLVQGDTKEILFAEGMASRVNGTVRKGIAGGTLEIQNRFFYERAGEKESYYYNPSVVIGYWRDVKFEIGADIVAGRKDTLVGFFRSNSQIYGIVRVFLD